MLARQNFYFMRKIISYDLLKPGHAEHKLKASHNSKRQKFMAVHAVNRHLAPRARPDAAQMAFGAISCDNDLLSSYFIHASAIAEACAARWRGGTRLARLYAARLYAARLHAARWYVAREAVHGKVVRGLLSDSGASPMSASQKAGQ